MCNLMKYILFIAYVQSQPAHSTGFSDGDVNEYKLYYVEIMVDCIIAAVQ